MRNAVTISGPAAVVRALAHLTHNFRLWVSHSILTHSDPMDSGTEWSKLNFRSGADQWKGSITMKRVSI